MRIDAPSYAPPVGSTFAKVLPLALGAAISPVILLLQVATLASPRYAVRRALVVLGATALVVALVMVAVVVTDHQATTVPKADPVVGGWIKVVLAILLLAGAVRVALAKAPEEKSPSASDLADVKVHAGRYFLLGVGAMVTNITTIVLLVPATRDAATADLASGDRLVVLAAVFVITLFPAYAPLLVLAALGKRGPRALAAMSVWLHAHHKAVTVVVSLGFSLYLGISGWIALS